MLVARLVAPLFPLIISFIFYHLLLYITLLIALIVGATLPEHNKLCSLTPLYCALSSPPFPPIVVSRRAPD